MAFNWIVGLPSIGRHMGWSALKVKRMALKYSFPLLRLPAANRQGWAWHTSNDLILAWCQTQMDEGRKRLAQSALGRPPALREGTAKHPWLAKLRSRSADNGMPASNPNDNS